MTCLQRPLGLITLTVATMLSTASLAQVDTRHVVHNSFGNIATNTFGNCVRSTFSGTVDECNPAQMQRTTRTEISKEERTVYFDFNKATLTAPARTRLDTLVSNLKSDNDVRQARIIGYADRIGTPEYNERLSQKRAETVRSYLIARGIVTAPKTETRWFGEANPATSCPDTLSREALIECLQKDRRVEIEVDYHTQGQAQPR